MIIVPVVLYGYETWSLTLRDRHRTGCFEAKREEVRGRHRKLHNEELHNLSPIIIIRMKSWRVKCFKEMTYAFKI
jgi:hypothetical protein